MLHSSGTASQPHAQAHPSNDPSWTQVPPTTAASTATAAALVSASAGSAGYYAGVCVTVVCVQVEADLDMQHTGVKKKFAQESWNCLHLHVL